MKMYALLSASVLASALLLGSCGKSEERCGVTRRAYSDGKLEYYNPITDRIFHIGNNGFLSYVYEGGHYENVCEGLDPRQANEIMQNAREDSLNYPVLHQLVSEFDEVRQRFETCGGNEEL